LLFVNLSLFIGVQMSNIEIGSLQNYQVSLTPDGKVDPLTGMGVEAGFFTTAQKGEVGFDLLHDSGRYKGEVAIFSLDGREELTSEWPSNGIGLRWPGRPDGQPLYGGYCSYGIGLPWPAGRIEPPPDYRFSAYGWHDSA
jgi:hypothetical protein